MQLELLYNLEPVLRSFQHFILGGLNFSINQ